MGTISDSDCVSGHLSLIFVPDTSASMLGEPIRQVNRIMERAIRSAKEAACEKGCALSVRVISCSSRAEWLLGSEAAGLQETVWQDLPARGSTDTAGALTLTCRAFQRDLAELECCIPVLVLISDGECDDSAEAARAAESLHSLPGVCIAVGVSDYNRAQLETFASHGAEPENAPLVFSAEDGSFLEPLMQTLAESAAELFREQQDTHQRE